MHSVITQPIIYAALAQGACTQIDLLDRLGIDCKTADRAVLNRFAGLLSLMERTGQIASEVGAQSGELRYAVVMGPDRQLLERRTQALERIADAAEHIGEVARIATDLLGRCVPFFIHALGSLAVKIAPEDEDIICGQLADEIRFQANAIRERGEVDA